jgi:hypothetical protein
MGEWSEYFEDLPEENSANYVGEKFDPAGAKALREEQQKKAQTLKNEQQQLNAEIAEIVRKHKRAD